MVAVEASECFKQGKLTWKKDGRMIMPLGSKLLINQIFKKLLTPPRLYNCYIPLPLSSSAITIANQNL